LADNQIAASLTTIETIATALRVPIGEFIWPLINPRDDSGSCWTRTVRDLWKL